MQDPFTQLRLPPRTSNWEGRDRRVGVELEFGAISARTGASLVQSLFGGTIEEEDPHRFHVANSSLGKFTCELDTQYAHRSVGERMEPEIVDEEDPLVGLAASFRYEMRRLYGDLSSYIVPCEIVCPPIALAEMPRLDAMVDALLAAGAEGTRSSPFYAFGAQLNPDIATKDAAWLTAMLKAYLLVSPWLRAVIQVHMTRRLVAFADPFPNEYVAAVVDARYWPSLDSLMRDYLAANPSRNRELDLLPLFAWLDAPLVRGGVPDHRIKARPAFHYRLPDSNLGVAGWSLTLEWNRWCVVERLAESHETLDAMGAAYRANLSRASPDDWAVRAAEWLVLS
jgi:hypothetical protein